MAYGQTGTLPSERNQGRQPQPPLTAVQQQLIKQKLILKQQEEGKKVIDEVLKETKDKDKQPGKQPGQPGQPGHDDDEEEGEGEKKKDEPARTVNPKANSPPERKPTPQSSTVRQVSNRPAAAAATKQPVPNRPAVAAKQPVPIKSKPGHHGKRR